MKGVTCEELKKLAYSEHLRAKYVETKEDILKRLDARLEKITSLENDHVQSECTLGAKDFLELCDRYIQASDDLGGSDDDEEEQELEFTDAEFWLDESTVPDQVWNALWE